MFNPLIVPLQGDDILVALMFVGLVLWLIDEITFNYREQDAAEDLDNTDIGETKSEYIRDFSRPLSLRESLRRQAPRKNGT
jgi:hypothetical protein